uniref:epithelial cell-transforming sequence 2 oncogene-like n=1 Tax=Myxine glutinosa TaxID=7769 RepID=UPI00358DFA7D
MTNQEAGLAVAEAFFALSQRKSTACPVEFLARFLHTRCEWKGCEHVGERKDLPERETQSSANSQPQGSATTFPADPRQHVGREAMAAKITRSETVYMRTLESLKKVYASPLKAAIASGRPIISAANVQIIVSDPLHIFDLHRDLFRGLQVKMVEGGPEHPLGEVFSRFTKKLGVYTSFFNNYSHVLQIIEECRDDSPAFRAFLKSRDYSPSTRMLSLPELLLEVARRLPCLLYELRSLHFSTSIEHSDRAQIAAAADCLQNYCGFIKKVKGRIQREAHLREVQQSIVECPKLQERQRFFICQQDVANLRRHANDPRIYEHVRDLGLYLFNDALVLTTCSVTHSPFERSRKTRHHFHASVSLTCLHLEDVRDSKYVCNAFCLRGTQQEWTCAVDTSEEKLTWVAALSAAIRSANWT